MQLQTCTNSLQMLQTAYIDLMNVLLFIYLLSSKCRLHICLVVCRLSVHVTTSCSELLSLKHDSQTFMGQVSYSLSVCVKVNQIKSLYRSNLFPFGDYVECRYCMFVMRCLLLKCYIVYYAVCRGHRFVTFFDIKSLVIRVVVLIEK